MVERLPADAAVTGTIPSNRQRRAALSDCLPYVTKMEIAAGETAWLN
jgi:hypothetical protein